MKRIHRLGSVLALALATWTGVLSHDLSPTQHMFVLMLPVLAVIMFGIYSVIALAIGVLTFKSWPEEAQLLKKEIEVAKVDLAKRGVIVGAAEG